MHEADWRHVELAQQLRLDVLTREVCRTLAASGVPHALLKGPTTAAWLYDPPRAYRDVDVLLPASALDRAVAALVVAGIAAPSAGGLGEEAPHSQLLLTPAGLEVDLHISLPMLVPAPGVSERVWRTLSSRVESFELMPGVPVPALDIPGRCLVLALHSLASGYDRDQVCEDLRRARDVATSEQWALAAELADELGIAELFAAGLAVVEPPEGGRQEPVVAYLKRTHAVNEAHGLQRLLDAPVKARPRMVLQEVFPSPGFIRHAFAADGAPRRALPRLYLNRVVRIAKRLPAAVASLRAAKSAGREPTRSRGDQESPKGSLPERE